MESPTGPPNAFSPAQSEEVIGVKLQLLSHSDLHPEASANSKLECSRRAQEAAWGCRAALCPEDTWILSVPHPRLSPVLPIVLTPN